MGVDVGAVVVAVDTEVREFCSIMLVVLFHNYTQMIHVSHLLMNFISPLLGDSHIDCSSRSYFDFRHERHVRVNSLVGTEN